MRMALANRSSLGNVFKMPKLGQTKDKLAKKVNGWRISDKKAPPEIRKAYKSWTDQRQRCHNPIDPRFKWWGANGIQVEYSAYDFVLWWVGEIKKNPGIKRPQCSRVDHDKNYRFGNIALLGCSENSQERMSRIGPPTSGTKICAVQLQTGESHWFRSCWEAHTITKISKSAILNQVNRGPQRTIRGGWVFFKDPLSMTPCTE